MTEIEAGEESVILLTIYKESFTCHNLQRSRISMNTPITMAYIGITKSAALIVLI